MVVGWDIGGVHTKVALVSSGQIVCVIEEPFELQRDPRGLAPLLRRLARDAGAPEDAPHAVTMTAELSQIFRTKRDGVAFVVDAVETAFPGAAVHLFTVSGTFTSPFAARGQPLNVAAANWMATARVVAQRHPDALLVDVGSTTTDIIPIAGGRVAAVGETDLGRLGAGELVYTGAVRTPVEAVVRQVTVRGTSVSVSAEGFALAGDAHVWRGDLHADDYSAPTPDGRDRSRDACGERLLRVVCADREMLGSDDISAIADEVAAAQVDQISSALRRVAATQPRSCPAVVTGRGAFLGVAAARRAGIEVLGLEQEIGIDAARSAPAVAVALLLEQAIGGDDVSPAGVIARAPGPSIKPAVVDLVVKIGGAALHQPEALARVLAELDTMSGAIVIVPGGGMFADAVREVDRRITLSESTAHWMAIRAMDQYAELLVERLGRGTLVRDLDGIGQAVRNGLLPVLAPHEWMRRDDPLPHSWEVTSDSIAAWVAGVTSARQLVLVKPGSPRDGGLTDPFFDQALPHGIRTAVAFLDRPGCLRAALAGPVPASRFAVACRPPSP